MSARVSDITTLICFMSAVWRLRHKWVQAGDEGDGVRDGAAVGFRGRTNFRFGPIAAGHAVEFSGHEEMD